MSSILTTLLKFVSIISMRKSNMLFFNATCLKELGTLEQCEVGAQLSAIRLKDYILMIWYGFKIGKSVTLFLS